MSFLSASFYATMAWEICASDNAASKRGSRPPLHAGKVDASHMAVVDEIKSRLDILDLVSRYVQLQRSGRSYKAACPFHAEKTPSFFVFPERQTWRCFGACATGGDLFSFYMRAENLDFAEALRRLGRETGVELPSRQDQGQRSQFQGINEEARKFFERLLASSNGSAASKYLEQRGILPATIGTFELGFSRPDGHSLRDFLTAQGFTPDQLVMAGLVTRTEREEYRDLFRGRLMFPIRGQDGLLCGFGARALDDSVPKYLNTPKTLAFDKGRILYGLPLARDNIREKGAVVVVEGYMDTIMAHQHRFTNVVASMGTALTSDQASTLRALAPEVVLALDPDTAGQEATLRSMESAWGVFHRQTVRTAAGASALYQRQELPKVKVAALPQGQDPDDVIRHSPEQWARLVDEAAPLMDYLFSALAMRLDPATPEGKAQLSQLLFPLVASIENPFLQDHYFQRLADLLGVPAESLQASLGRAAGASARTRPDRRRSRREEEISSSPFARLERDPLEEHCLALLLQNPELAATAKSLRLEYFSHPENREVLAYWMEEHDPDLLDPELRQQWDHLLSMSLPPSDQGQREMALKDCLSRMEARYLRHLKAEEELRLAEVTPQELEEYQQDILHLNRRMKDLLAEKVS